MTFYGQIRTPTKAASVPFNPSGFWHGRIVKLSGVLADIVVPRIAGDFVYKNVEIAGDMPLAVNDAVWVTFIEGIQDELVVVDLVRHGQTPPARWYGSFFDTTTQLNAGSALVNTMSYNTTVSSNGVVVHDDTKISFEHSGCYNIQFSAQFDKTDSGDDDVEVWFSRNGIDIPWSSTILTVHANNGRAVAAWNLVLDIVANDYVEIKWHSTDSAMRVLARESQASPQRPAIPSVILTVVPV